MSDQPPPVKAEEIEEARRLLAAYEHEKEFGDLMQMDERWEHLAVHTVNIIPRLLQALSHQGEGDDGPGRVAFVRDTLTRLMEQAGGPHSRVANITLSGSTIADWLIRLSEVDPAPQGGEWRAISEAPEGRCLMWVKGAGHRGEDCCLFGTVYVYPDARSYRPDGCHGNWTVTHFQPIPHGPTPPKEHDL